MRWGLLILSLLTTKVYSEGNDPPTPGYRNVAYFVNWAIYGRNFTPQELPASKLTHVLYAFANVKPDTGEVYLSDDYADTKKRFPGDLQDDSSTNLYGSLKQLYLLKKQNRNLKVLLSIGGWTYSSNFAGPASTSIGRSTFASSAVSLVKNLGLDGLDIDWEYPADDAQALNFVLLLQAVREALDAYGTALNPQYHFQLTVACPAGPKHYQRLYFYRMDPYIDFWNLMAYDYAGAWGTSTGNQANLFSSKSNATSTPFNTNRAVNYYISHGVSASKIVLGIPLYGRSFEFTEGLGLPFNGVGRGSWEAGVHDFKILPYDGALEFYDNTTGSSFSYDGIKKELISYDNIMVVKQKAAWIQTMGLGGAMWWESSADREGNQSLIQNVADALSSNGGGLESSINQLLYADSAYDNLRAEIPGSGSTSLISPSTTTSTVVSSPYSTVSSIDTPVLSLPLLNLLTVKSQAYPSKHRSPIFIPDLSTIQDLYQTPFNTTSLFSPSIQQPLSLNPNLQPQHHGTIHMLPIHHGISHPQTLSLTFTTSQKICAPLSHKYTSLLEELAFNLLYDYPTGIHQTEPVSPFSGPTFTLSETISLHNNFYASLYLKISEDIEEEEWEKVVRLLTRTAEALEEERGDIGLERGAGRTSVLTKIKEREINATWLFYQMVDGVMRECGEENETLDIGLGFGFNSDEGARKDAVGGKREDL